MTRALSSNSTLDANVLHTPETLKFALRAFHDKTIYHQKNLEAKRRGDCMENTVRLIRFLRVSGLNLADLRVFIMRRCDEDELELDPHLLVDKDALREEERAFSLRQFLLGRHRRERTFWRLHVMVIDQYNRVYDLSARQDLLGSEFRPYFEVLFKTALERNRELFLNEFQLSECPATEFLRRLDIESDDYWSGFHRRAIETLISEI